MIDIYKRCNVDPPEEVYESLKCVEGYLRKTAQKAPSLLPSVPGVGFPYGADVERNRHVALHARTGASNAALGVREPRANAASSWSSDEDEAHRNDSFDNKW